MTSVGTTVQVGIDDQRLDLLVIPVDTNTGSPWLPTVMSQLNSSISPPRIGRTIGMTMGDRIKTRQQLHDQQAGAADFGTPPAVDRRNESTHPDQAQDGTVTQVGQDGADAVRHELKQLHERMDVIKQEAAAEVDRKWASPWRTPEVFDLKVKTRLTSHQEYRSLQERVRDAKASLAEFDAATEAGTAG